MPAKARRGYGDGSIFQRKDGYWVAAVQLTPGPDGKRRVKRVVRKTKTDAAAELRALRSQVERGEIATTASATVTTWAEHWLESIAPNKLRPQALATNTSYLKHHVLPVIGSKRLNKLTPADIRAVTTRITENGLATGTAKNVHWLLSGVIDDAVKAGTVHANVVNRVDPPQVKRSTRRPLTQEEAVRILTHLAAEADRDPAKVRDLARWSIGLFTGARQADILGLEWDRIDLEAGTADISWSLQWLPLKEGVERGHGRHKTGNTVYQEDVFAVAAHTVFRPVWRSACLVETKTRKGRIVPLIPPLVAALSKLKGQSREGLVFVTTSGTPVRRGDDTKAWNTLTASLGIVGVQQHGARHTTATLLLAAGVPEDVRMSILGHNTAAAHRGYAHIDQTVARAALESAFGDMLR